MISTVITLGERQYNALVVENDEEAAIGLSEVSELPDNYAMVFPYDDFEKRLFTMEDTSFPLDIVFIDDTDVVIRVVSAEAESLEPAVGYAQTVVEINPNSGIVVGDTFGYAEDVEVESDDDDEDSIESVMLVLNPKGNAQMVLKGNERIFSRKSTKVLIRKAKKANKTKADKDFKSLGLYMINELNAQDSRDIEYVKE